MASDNDKKVLTCLGCFGCGLVLMALCLPFAFTYVEYDEWAFYKNTFASTVDTSEVYTEGRYFWGWPGDAVRFPNTYQFVQYSGQDALASFTAEGLEVKVECSFQYKLIKEELPELFGDFSVNYHTQIQSVGKANIKNTLRMFQPSQLLENRKAVADAVAANLTTALNVVHASMPATKFQLRKITFPPGIRNKYLTTATQQLRGKEQEYKKTADLIRKDTEVLSKSYDANVTRILERANAEADLTKNTASYEARAIISSTEGEGYAMLFKTIGIENNVPLQQKFLKLDALLEGEVKPQLLFGLQTANVMLNAGK